MKYLFSIFFILVSLFSCTSHSTEEAYVLSIKNYQADMIAFYNGTESPLSQNERKEFKGLKFYPIDSTYRVTAKFVKASNHIPIAIPTSTSKVDTMYVWGTLYFKINNQQQQLTVFINKKELITQTENHLFIPFKDRTCGTTSYGGGRMLSLASSDIVNQNCILDFNKTYNPYCVYSKSYTCALPPQENYLSIAIPAGMAVDN